MSGRPTAPEVSVWANSLDAVGERIDVTLRGVSPGNGLEPRHRLSGTSAVCLAMPSRRTAGNWPSTSATRARGLQHLLARANCDTDAVRDDLLGYVAESHSTPEGVQIVDETGFLKTGTKSVRVARQYNRTAGRSQNCRVGVFLGYATPKRCELLDCELYLPKKWGR